VMPALGIVLVRHTSVSEPGDRYFITQIFHQPIRAPTPSVTPIKQRHICCTRQYYRAHASGTNSYKGADTAALKHPRKQATGLGFKPLLGHCTEAAPLMEMDTVIHAKA
jgi:hypothetical protein